MFDLIRLSILNLNRKKFRSFLTIMGISIGVASVILVGNISQCGISAINTELDSLGLNGLSVSANSFSAKQINLSESDLKTIKENHYVEGATPIMVENTFAYNKANDEINTLLWGIDSNANQIISLNILYGRSINNLDISSSSNVCMVDENFSKLIYKRKNIIGKEISILCGGNIDKYKVIGVIKTGSGLLQNIMGDYIPNFVYIPYTNMQNFVGRKSFDQIAVKTTKNADMNIAGKDIVKTLNKNYGITDGYRINDLSKQKQGLIKLLNIVTLILSAVGFVSLVVASLSIMTVMLVSVNERKKEIGIKKSIGATKKIILFEFLLEALFLSLIGCFVGILIGNGISFAGAKIFKINLDFRMDIMIISICFSIFSSVLFGVYPAIKAARLNPVEALRG